MNPFKRLQKQLIFAGTAVLSVIVILSILQSMNASIGSERLSYNLLSSLNYALVRRPAQSVTRFFSDFVSLWKVQDENEVLRREIEKMAQFQSTTEQLYRENRELQALLDLKLSLVDYDAIPTTVIQRDGMSYSHTLMVDVGSADGVSVNDAVMSSKGVVGKIISVSEHQSVVLLLTTENDSNKFPVKIQVDASKTSEAILEYYDPNEESYLLKLLDTNSSINVGMKVISSGSGGYFPNGLLVGTVNFVESLPNALGLKILVTPAADFYQLDYLMVIKLGARNYE